MSKSKYETHVLLKLDKVEEWAKRGLIDEQIAHNLGIAYSTFREYKNTYSALSAALKRGKEVIDLEVENALLKRALGYKYNEITKEPVKNDVTGKIELQVIKEVTKEVLPDVTAQIFWLKNRRPEDWRDKKEIFSSGTNTIQVRLED
jgi:hypothetical protein